MRRLDGALDLFSDAFEFEASKRKAASSRRIRNQIIRSKNGASARTCAMATAK